jgi:divalent metal cation (Fe/Co/Zn/Cd) transporter
MPISERMAHRTAGVLLLVLAFVVAVIAVGSLVLRLRPEASRAGIGITIAALIAMPVLASLKRHEARRNSNLSFTPDCAGIADGCFAEACFFFGF